MREETTHNNTNIWFLYLWGFSIATIPLIINIFLKKPNFDQYKDQLLQKGWLLLTGLSMPNPEQVWILPKIILLLIISIISILYIIDNFALKLPILLMIIYSLEVIISGLFSGDSLQYVLLGGDGRMDGLIYAVSLIIYFLFSFLLTINYKKLAVIIFTYSILFSALFESIIVIAQRLGYDYVGALTVGMRYPLITGTAGNPGMVAALLLPALVIIIGLSIHNKNAFQFFITLLLSFLLTIALSLVNNRTSFYTIVFIIIVYIYFYKYNYKIYILSILTILTLIATPAMIPNQTQVQTRSLTNTKTLSTRLKIWDIAVKVSRKTLGQPFIGGGFDALKLGIIKHDLAKEYLSLYREEAGWPSSVVIDEYRWLHEPSLPLKTSALLVYAHDSVGGKHYDGVYKIVLDKAHNYWLDRTVSTGLLSAIIWLYLFIWPLIPIFRSKNVTAIPYAVAVLALIIYYSLWFPVPQVEPIHTALLAVVWGMSYLHD